MNPNKKIKFLAGFLLLCLCLFAFAVPAAALTISSSANQAFVVGDPATTISTITITANTRTEIKFNKDIEIMIPSGFNMTWDTSVTTVTVGGSASGKVSALVSYQDSDQTLVMDVTSTFSAGEQITIDGAKFTNFSAGSAPDNLDLYTTWASATDDKAVAISAPTISSAANQSFIVEDAATAVSTITVSDFSGTPTITAANDIRIRIPSGFNMTWDTTDTTAVIDGGASGKVSSTVSYEDSDKTLVVNVDTDFAASDQITVSGLSFTNFSAASAADNLELEIKNNGVITSLDDKTIIIIAPTISSAANQSFYVDDTATAVSTITVTDVSGTPTITAANDIRIRIPSGFNMTWDATGTTAVIGGGASGKVSTTVSYEDSDKTLIVDVTSDFAASDQITVSGLSFTSFSAVSAADNLELEVKNNGSEAAADDKTITILRSKISSAADQYFVTGDPATAVSTITIIDIVGGQINSNKDIRIEIPSGFNMTWDNSVTTLTIGGGASGKVSTTVSYENGDQTLVIYVTTNFVANDQIIVSGAKFTNFSAASAADNLELDTFWTSDIDDKTIVISEPTISSAANQTFTVGDPATAVSTITVTDDGTTPSITVANDIRVRIPSGFNMTWDTSDTAAVIGGGASGKVSTTVSYEDSDTTMVVDVTSDFVAGDQISISDLSFTSFSAASTVDNLELEVKNNGGVAATDDKTIAILAPTISSAANQTFTIGDPITAVSTITVTDDSSTATITLANDIRIRIPSGFNMTWDITDTTAVIGGGASGKVSTTVSYEDSSKTLVLNVTGDFLAGEQITVSDLSFTDFGAPSAADNLELEVKNNGGAAAVDDKTIAINPDATPYLYSAADQIFIVGGSATAISMITIIDGSTPAITGANDIRIRIPSGFNMIWDTSDTTAVIGGVASGKVSTLVSYDDNKTLVLNVTSDFVSGDYITASDLSFTSFSTASDADYLELEVNNDDVVTDDDDKVIRIINSSYGLFSAADQAFMVGSPSTIMRTITIIDDAVTPTITAGNDLRIQIPSGFNMIWDTSITTVTIGGGASGKVSTTVSYEDSDMTIVLDVTTNFAASEAITVSGPKFVNFTAESSADNLELDVDNDDVAEATDDKTITIIAFATVVNLISFTAKGGDDLVLVEWETAQEIDNMGFYLYRASSQDGPFSRLTEKMIPGLFSSIKGKIYTYEDRNVTEGELFYYRLEDIDIYGNKGLHGPICVDWDWDGLPDDWEIAHGLDPDLDDSGLDPDFDGLTNLQEYERGTDPLNPDTDGDELLDGLEERKSEREAVSEARTFSRGVRIVSSDDTGITVELQTDAFDPETVRAGGENYQRLRIPDYIHGFTEAVGAPELPMKGILLELPQGKSATLRVEGTEKQTYPGYRIYPVPRKVVQAEGEMAHVDEVFTIDEAAYLGETFYPEVVARLGKTYTFRDKQKLQVLFYPLAFNPATRQLAHYSKILVRVDYKSVRGKLFAEEIPQISSSRFKSWSAPSEDPAYKIITSDEGIYRLTGSYLEAYGVDVEAMDLSQVRLYNLGEEAGIFIYDQNEDNHLDEGDYIEFYAMPIATEYAKYAKNNVYWLTTEGGIGYPKRMDQTYGLPGSAPVPETHTFTVHHEKDQWYWLKAPGEDAVDRWVFYPFVMGGGLQGGGDPVDYTISLPGVAGAGNLDIYLYGVYETDHVVDVSVNGAPAGSFSWSNIAPYLICVKDVDLLEGNNTISIQCSSAVDSIGVDWIEVTYPRDFSVSNNSLKFTCEVGYGYQVSEFTGDDLLAFDITSSGDVQRIVNFQISGSGPYTMDFEPFHDQNTVGERSYLVLSSEEVKTPSGMKKDTSSTLSDAANGADYILITHRDLGWDQNAVAYPWINDLVSLRQGQGHRVKVVKVEDIYNEFSYGIPIPQAVKDFLTYAYTNWIEPAPRYVLLVGDGTYDPKDNWSGFFLSTDTTAYLPAYLTYTDSMGETVADEWFVRVSGEDKLPDMYIGRLPAANADQAAVMVNKIIAYETAPNTKTWEKNVLLLADNQVEEGEEVFETMSEDVAALLPEGLNAPFKGYLGDYAAKADLTADIKEKINEGTLIVNYSGHGSTQIWANEKIFENGDVADLNNEDMLPFFVNMSCLTGSFTNPESWNSISMAEALIRAEGKGAIAALMPTGMTSPTGQRILNTALFDTIFTQDLRTLGPAISLAKETLLANGEYFDEISETFLLFGDPALKLKIPLPDRPKGFKAQEGEEDTVVLSWQEATDCDEEAVAGYNLYRSQTSGGNYTRVNTSLITETEYEDASLSGGTTYYYVLTSADVDGYESIRSLERGATAKAPPPVVIITSTTGLTTTESQSTATFTVVLDTEPTAEVIIGISSSDETEGTVSPASLAFTSTNWNSVRTVTITGVNDDLDDGDVSYTILTAAVVSGDTNYSGFDPQNVSVTNQDNEPDKPVARFQATLQRPDLRVYFKNESTGDITRLTWNYGDGQSFTTEEQDQIKTDQYHTYTEPGTYTVNLTAYNNCGSDTMSWPVIFPQGSLTGIITDMETGEIIADANLVLFDIGRTVSDETGSYSFEEIFNGEYRIEILKSGYKPYHQKGILIYSDTGESTKILDFQLDPKVGFISGRVIKDSFHQDPNEPLGDATLVAYSISDPNIAWQAKTCPNGFFTFYLSTGEYKVSASAKGCLPLLDSNQGNGYNIDVNDPNSSVEGLLFKLSPKPSGPSLNINYFQWDNDPNEPIIENRLRIMIFIDSNQPLVGDPLLVFDPNVMGDNPQGTLSEVEWIDEDVNIGSDHKNHYHLVYSGYAGTNVYKLGVGITAEDADGTTQTSRIFSVDPATQPLDFDIDHISRWKGGTIEDIIPAEGGQTGHVGLIDIDGDGDFDEYDESLVNVPAGSILGSMQGEEYSQLDELSPLWIEMARQPARGENTLSAHYDIRILDQKSNKVMNTQINKIYPITIYLQPDLSKFNGRLANLGIKYQDPDTGQWKTDGIINIRVTDDYKIAFDVEHLTLFGAFCTTPTNLTAVVDEYNESIELVWQDNSDNEAVFEIYREEEDGSIFVLLDNTAPNVADYIDITCLGDKIYSYKVRAVTPLGPTDYSNESRIPTPKNLMDGPTPEGVTSIGPLKGEGKGCFIDTAKDSFTRKGFSRWLRLF